MTAYVAWWPVLDDTATLADLIAEATDDLAEMVDAEHHVIVGPVRWDTDERDAGLVLMASAQVQQVTYKARPASHRRAAA